jgi:hypothetical protein
LEPQLLFKFPVACVLTRGNQSFDIPEGVADIRLLYKKDEGRFGFAEPGPDYDPFRLPAGESAIMWKPLIVKELLAP